MGIESLIDPKPLSHYKDLTNGGEFTVGLTQEEACLSLKIHDYGVDSLTTSEKALLHSIFGKLKNEVWP